MTYDSLKHHRRSARLKGYDYSQAGAYYITVCAQDRACLFGDVAGDQMRLNNAGRVILAEWSTLPARFPAVHLDSFVVMPNHIHGIIVISTAGRNAKAGFPTPTLGDVVGAFKSLTTDLYIRGVKQNGWSAFRGRLWQRNYHEHIIRNDESLHRIRQYIVENPARWASDPENPQARDRQPDGLLNGLPTKM